FIRGDALLRVDRRLASLLDGVYHPSEFYLRWLERLTSLNFGTAAGRLLTRWVTVPFGGAFLLLIIAEEVLKLFSVPAMPAPFNYIPVILLGFFLMALMHAERFRERVSNILPAVGHGLRVAFWDWPRRHLPLAALHRLFTSWPFQLFTWYVL